MRVAIADGATDAVYSGLWARLLVRAYGRHDMTGLTAQDNLNKAAKVWKRIVARIPLPWYAEEKARAGAFAALVGLELNRQGDLVPPKRSERPPRAVVGLQPNRQGDRPSGAWSVLAFGDSCFFHLRSNKLLKSFPLSRANDFSSSPLLLGSNRETSPSGDVRMERGSWQNGDCFYLMTDALASWFLSAYESGESPWLGLGETTLQNDATFNEWISCLRQDRAIKNDDCTLIRIATSAVDE